MNLMTRRLTLPALALASALALAACSGSSSPASPSASSPSAASSGSVAPAGDASSAATTATPLKSVNPCLVMTAGAVDKYKMTAGKPSGLKQDVLAPSPQTVVAYCGIELHDRGSLYVLDVQMELQAGLGDLHNSSTLAVSAAPAIDGHPTRLVKFTAKNFAYCGISVGVTSSSRSDLLMANGSGDFAKNCAEIKKIAPLVVPQLPAAS